MKSLKKIKKNFKTSIIVNIKKLNHKYTIITVFLNPIISGLLYSKIWYLTVEEKLCDDCFCQSKSPFIKVSVFLLSNLRLHVELWRLKIQLRASDCLSRYRASDSWSWGYKFKSHIGCRKYFKILKKKNAVFLL